VPGELSSASEISPTQILIPEGQFVQGLIAFALWRRTCRCSGFLCARCTAKAYNGLIADLIVIEAKQAIGQLTGRDRLLVTFASIYSAHQKYEAAWQAEADAFNAVYCDRVLAQPVPT
jgi:hypothetical protein